MLVPWMFSRELKRIMIIGRNSSVSISTSLCTSDFWLTKANRRNIKHYVHIKYSQLIDYENRYKASAPINIIVIFYLKNCITEILKWMHIYVLGKWRSVLINEGLCARTAYRTSAVLASRTTFALSITFLNIGNINILFSLFFKRAKLANTAFIYLIT